MSLFPEPMISMNKLIRTLLASFAVTALFAAAPSFAPPAAPEKDKDYKVLATPQPVDAGAGKIEVTEFFWYGCPHCNAMEPYVNAWLKNMPKGVVFKRGHAYPSASWGPMASLYSTLEAMGLVDQYHSKVFDAIHKQNVNLNRKDK